MGRGRLLLLRGLHVLLPLVLLLLLLRTQLKGDPCG